VATPGSASRWRFLVDENLPRSLATDMRAAGYQADHVYDLGMAGSKDPAVYVYAQAQRMTIITGDKDFSNILMYPPPHAGLVIVEVSDTMLPDARKRIILRQLATLSGQSLENTLVIIEPGRVRIRR
jgi:predicted nuclease of predicted toxin-antitoxin system